MDAEVQLTAAQIANARTNTAIAKRNAGEFAGAAVTKAREIANLPAIEAVKESSKHATVCGRCLKPLKPMEPVKLLLVKAKTDPEAFEARRKGNPFASVMRAPPPAVYAEAPVCIGCWLIRMQDDEERAKRNRFCFANRDRVWLRRCGGCGRPMRVKLSVYNSGIRAWRRAKTCGCCADCDHAIELKRLRTIRKVGHETVECKVCGEPFVQKRTDAVTCSAKCRQKLHRDRLAQPE